MTADNNTPIQPLDNAALTNKAIEHEARIKKLESMFVSETPKLAKSMSVREFLLSKKPGNDNQKTLVVGYYLETHEKKSPFNVKDLECGFDAAKEKCPKNLNDTVYQNVKKGLLRPAKEKKDKLSAWDLTNSGIAEVEAFGK